MRCCPNGTRGSPARESVSREREKLCAVEARYGENNQPPYLGRKISPRFVAEKSRLLRPLVVEHEPQKPAVSHGYEHIYTTSTYRNYRNNHSEAFT